MVTATAAGRQLEHHPTTDQAARLADQWGPLIVDAGTDGPRSYATPAAPYDAAGDQRGRRKTITPSHHNEDQLLPPHQRARTVANARDLVRNFSLATWAIRRHLDYVAEHQFQATTPDQGYNQYLEDYVYDWTKRRNFDRAGRHDLQRYVRLAETLAVTDGDELTVRLADGTMQGIEGDRIRNPWQRYCDAYATQDDWTHGVRTDEAGRHLAYAIHRRARNSFEFEREVPATDCHFHGYFTRLDQTRGVSPLVSALNSFRDAYENIDLALAKAKVSQLFALAITRNADVAAGEVGEDGTGYSVDFGKGPIVLDLEPGDDAKFLGEQTPSPAFQQFMTSVCMLALKALDIPYSFFDEAHTNFFGSRGAWLHYERSAVSKRRNIGELLATLTQWRFQYGLATKTLDLPRGMSFPALLKAAVWVPRGMPWWKPTEELAGDLMAISAGLTNPERVARERDGGDVYANLEITARVIAAAKAKGLTLNFAPPPPQPQFQQSE